MSDEELEKDDEDSYSVCSQDPTGGENSEPEKAPTLEDHITRILSEMQFQCLDAKTDKNTDIAKSMTSRLLNTAYNMQPMYRKYLKSKGGKIADVVDFRCMESNVYQCLVEMRRPVRPDTFDVNFKLPTDFPNHRILISINESWSSVDRMQVLREWGHCVDKSGTLRPDLILEWFNEGLKESTELLRHIKPVEANRIKGAKLLEMSSKRRKDGTSFIDFVWETEDRPRTHVRVNIVPCIVMFELPRQIRLSAPIPSRRPYLDSKTDFMHTINNSLESGEKILFLEARLLRKPHQNGYHPSILCSWGVNIARFEETAMEYIEQMNRQDHFRDIVTLFSRIKKVHHVCLHSVTHRILLNVILYQHQKHLGEIESREGWFIKILEKLQACLSSGQFYSFFQRKYNLFDSIEKEVLKFTAKELKQLIVSLRKNPENIFIFVGLEDSILAEDEENQNEADNQPKEIEGKSKTTTDDDSSNVNSEKNTMNVEQEQNN